MTTPSDERLLLIAARAAKLKLTPRKYTYDAAAEAAKKIADRENQLRGQRREAKRAALCSCATTEPEDCPLHGWRNESQIRAFVPNGNERKY